jgi:DNA gyrase subunit B
MPAVEVVLTVLHAGGKFGGDGYKVSGGLHGVGVSVVNALSTSMDVQVKRDGKIHEISFKRGVTQQPLTVTGDTETTGTRVHFVPDPEIFSVTTYSYETLRHRLRELAFLNKGIRIRLTDKRTLVDEFIQDESGESKATGKQVFKSELFYSEEGLKEFIDYLDAGASKLIPDPICVSSDKIIPIDIALQYNTGYSEKIYSYVNNINTIEGGKHLQGFKMGLSRSLKNYADKNKLLEKDEDAVVAVLTASIDFHKETGKGSRVVSVTRIEE